MMKIRILKYFSPFFLLFSIFISCRKDDRFWWKADFSGPIARATLNIQNLFPDSLLLANNDSSLLLSYDETIFDLKLDSLFSIPDTTLDTAYISPFGGFSFQPGDLILLSPQNENYLDIDGVKLRQLILKRGKIKLELISSVSEPLNFKFDLFNTDLYGVPFVINESIAANGSVTKYYDISGLNFNLTGLNGNRFNTLVSQNTINVANNANPGVVNFGQGVIIKITFMEIIPFYAKGYLGQISYSVPFETIKTDIFSGLKADYFSLQDATVNLEISNGIGADIQVNNVILKSINNSNSSLVVLSGNGVNSSYNLNRANFQNLLPQPVLPTIKNYLINSTNSNIKSFIENLPDQFGYSADLLLNPMGNVSGNNDFVMYGYGLKTSMKVEIPFAFSAQNLRFQDTSTVDFSSLNLENINEAVITLYVDNAYPFSAKIQGFLCDENYSILDSLFDSPDLISASNVNSNYLTLNSVKSILHCNFSESRLGNLKKSRKIIFSVKMNTVSAPQVVKILNYYKMDISMTADVNYSVNR